MQRAKPDPEIFLKAAGKLNLKPDECVVIEDALHGVKAAKNAGIPVILIPDGFTKQQAYENADLQLNSIIELNDQVLSKLGE